jgi:hypothetical protein
MPYSIPAAAGLIGKGHKVRHAQPSYVSPPHDLSHGFNTQKGRKSTAFTVWPGTPVAVLQRERLLQHLEVKPLRVSR